MRGQALGSKSLRHPGPPPDIRADRGRGGGPPALCWLGVPRTLWPFQRALFIEHQLFAKLNWGDNTTMQGPLEGCEWLPPSGSLPGLGRLSPCHTWLPSRTSPAPLSSVRLCIQLSLAPDLLGPSWGGCLGVGARGTASEHAVRTWVWVPWGGQVWRPGSQGCLLSRGPGEGSSCLVQILVWGLGLWPHLPTLVGTWLPSGGCAARSPLLRRTQVPGLETSPMTSS